MKSLRLLLLVLSTFSLQLSPALRAAQGIKDLTLTGTTTDSSAHTFLTGSVVTFNSGSTLTVNGAFAGTATGGTLNLSALTLTLPSKNDSALVAVFAGEVVADQIFGTFKAARDLDLTGAQVFAQDAPTGSALTLDIINSGGTEQGKTITLAAGATTQETTFGSALRVSAGSTVRFKIKTVGSTNAGSWLSLSLLFTRVSP